MSLNKQSTATGELPRVQSTMSGVGMAQTMSGTGEKQNELFAVNGKPLDFSFKNICNLIELKSIEARSGKRKPIQTDVVVPVEDDKKFGEDDEESKKEGEDNEREDLKEKEESKEGEEGGEKANKDKKEEKKKPERKEPEIIRAIPSNTTSNIISNNHIPLNTGPVKTVGGKIIEEAKTSAHRASKKVNSICTSLMLGYNKIRSLEDFYTNINSVMIECSYLGYLDLSHNYLQTIDCDFSQFPNLKILYLHCNYIKDLKQIAKLQAPLISLTIHGNPIESIPSFRQFIISVIPTLKNLDTAPISKKERDSNDSNIKRLLLRVPPPVAKAADPPAENTATTQNSNNDNKNN